MSLSMDLIAGSGNAEGSGMTGNDGIVDKDSLY